METQIEEAKFIVPVVAGSREHFWTLVVFQMGGEDAGSGSCGAGAAAGSRRQLHGEPAPPAPGCRVPPPQSGSRDEADIWLARHLLRDQARPARFHIVSGFHPCSASQRMIRIWLFCFVRSTGTHSTLNGNHLNQSVRVPYCRSFPSGVCFNFKEWSGSYYLLEAPWGKLNINQSGLIRKTVRGSNGSYCLRSD